MRVGPNEVKNQSVLKDYFFSELEKKEGKEKNRLQFTDSLPSFIFANPRLIRRYSIQLTDGTKKRPSIIALEKTVPLLASSPIRKPRREGMYSLGCFPRRSLPKYNI